MANYYELKRELEKAAGAAVTVDAERDGRTLAFDLPRETAADREEQSSGVPYGLSLLYPTVVGGVVEGMPAEAAGLKEEDRITRVAGTEVRTWKEMREEISRHPGEEIEIAWLRDGEPMTALVTPEPRPDGESTIGQIGIGPHTSTADVPFGEAASLSASGLVNSAGLILEFIGSIFEEDRYKELGGPILIAKMADDTAERGLEPFIYFLALLSVNLAILNLMPIPALDGGHLVFLTLEAVHAKAAVAAQKGVLPAGRPRPDPGPDDPGDLQRPQPAGHPLHLRAVPVVPAALQAHNRAPQSLAMSSRQKADSSGDEPGRLTAAIRGHARSLGFDLFGVTPAEPLPGSDFYARWVALGYAGEMEYLRRNREKRGDPRLLVPGAVSVICVGMNYYPGPQEETAAGCPDSPGLRGRIAAYARGDDYHELVKKRLAELWRFIEEEAGRPVRGRWYVDTAPVLERELAQRAGLGWWGKNTCLINKRQGSWFFLGEIITDLELPFDEPRGRPLRHLHPLPRRLPHRRLPGTVRPRLPPLHLLPDHRAADRHTRDAASRYRRLAVRLRRLPGGLPVEPQGGAGSRDRLCLPSGTGAARPGRTDGARCGRGSTFYSETARSRGPNGRDSCATSPSRWAIPAGPRRSGY